MITPRQQKKPACHSDAPPPFPSNSLEECVRFLSPFKEKDVLTPSHLARAAGTGRRDKFRQLLSSSYAYRLIIGSHSSSHIRLAELGKRVMRPVGREDQGARAEAARKPNLFDRVFRELEEKQWPLADLANALSRKFGVPAERATSCRDIILQNMGFIGYAGADSVAGPQDPKAAERARNGEAFTRRMLHQRVAKHGKEPFVEGQYTEAVDECCKAFEKHVKTKSGLGHLSGAKLMQEALKLKGALWLNPQETTTEKNLQRGLMSLSVGLMAHLRNPLEHEPKLDLQLGRQDALDMLSLISYLCRQVDNTTMDSMRI